jgi:hypothetical protein
MKISIIQKDNLFIATYKPKKGGGFIAIGKDEIQVKENVKTALTAYKIVQGTFNYI